MTMNMSSAIRLRATLAGWDGDNTIGLRIVAAAATADAYIYAEAMTSRLHCTVVTSVVILDKRWFMTVFKT